MQGNKRNILVFSCYVLCVLLFHSQIVMLVYIFASKQRMLSVSEYINPGPGLYFNSDKPSELLMYLTIAFLVGLSYLSLLLLRRYSPVIYYVFLERIKDFILNRIRFLIFLVLSLSNLCFLISYFNHDEIGFVIGLSCLAFQGWYVLRNPNPNKVKVSNDGPIIGTGIFMVFLWSVIIFYSTFISLFYERPMLINEYLNLPEYTQVDEALVHNGDYLNSRMESPVSKYWTVDRPLPRDNSIQYVLNKSIGPVFDLENEKLWYDPIKQRVYLNSVVDSLTINILDSDDLADLNYANHAQAALLKYRISTDRFEENVVGFMKDNYSEIRWGVMDRYVIHHHSFILSPINDYLLGRDENKITAQYGIGSIKFFSWVLSAFNAVSFNGWFKIFAISYVLYFTLFVLLIFHLFNNRTLAFVVTIISFALINFKGYDFIIIGPGDSPWRHFFDLFVIFFLYQAWKSKKIYCYGLAMFFALLSIIVNPQVGLMVWFALFLSLVVYVLLRGNHSFSAYLVLVLYLFVGVFLYKTYPANNELAGYYFAGVVGMPFTLQNIVVVAFVLLLVFSVMFFLSGENLEALPYVLILFLILYAAGLFTYVVWHHDINGYLPRSHIYVLAIFLLVWYGYQYFKIQIPADAFYMANVFVLLFLATGYFFSYKHFNKTKKEYFNVFKEHKTYEWDFARLDAVSTVDPQYFRNDIGLIKKYVSHEEGLYIISEYDNILTFLAERYSAMPFFDLKWYLMTSKEMDKVVNLILDEKPEYLFVDRYINRNFNDDIIDPNLPVIGHLYHESVWRVNRRKLMQRVFYSVYDLYERVEEGSLISIYRIKI